jgi:hypothetical protein
MIWHRNFKGWNTDDLAKTFGLSHTSACALPSEWTNSRHPVPDELRGWLENRRTELFRLQFAWNEQELMVRYIGPLLTSIDFLG